MNNSTLAEKRILVVEDNSINQMLVRHNLSKSGAIVDIANNGTHALSFIESNTYDVILMDLFMPELDGYQTTKIIREELHLSLPIIAMTALGIKGEIEKCYSLGMNGYVAKPFTVESLNAEIIRVLQAPTTVEEVNKHLKLGDSELHIDLNFLQQLAAGDNQYMKAMIKLFVENTPITLDSLYRAIARNDWHQVFKLAHFLKSSLSVIKIKEMYNLILLIEQMATNEKNAALANNIIDQLATLYAKAELLLQKANLDRATVKQVA
ncbi:MAG: response regulator [Chitinophagaceae bacterium]|jgi:CheY-like chemotaxis protein|nr:response regulator [Chitinophagaceae bacterium]